MMTVTSGASRPRCLLSRVNLIRTAYSVTNFRPVDEPRGSTWGASTSWVLVVSLLSLCRGVNETVGRFSQTRARGGNQGNEPSPARRLVSQPCMFSTTIDESRDDGAAHRSEERRVG